MKLCRNKFFLSLTFSAAVFFLSISLGGEYVHGHIHHHATQDEHDACPVYQLLAQVFLFVVAAAACLQEVCICTSVVADEIFIPPQKYLLPGLRAPPISL